MGSTAATLPSPLAAAVVSLTSAWREECLPFHLIHATKGQDPRLSVECVHSAELRVKPSGSAAALSLFLSLRL